MKNIIFGAILFLLIYSQNQWSFDLRRSVIFETKVEQNKNKTNSGEAAYSEKRLGSFIKNDATYFRLFAPNAVKVTLAVYDGVNGSGERNFETTEDADGVWEAVVEENLNGKFYGYKVFHEGDDLNDSNQVLCVDPYAKAVASFTTYFNPRKSIVYQHEYDWEGDEWIRHDWRDLMIYEMHVRDMTAHSSSGAKHPGTYLGLIEKKRTGGIDYIKYLGVNTVELLPAMEFGTCEIPYEDSLKEKYNTWNPYERNYWGYMTSNFFAPEAYYAEDWQTLEWNKWMGVEGKQVEQFKDMVKAFHKEGIAVMMDVVYNHLSEYELGNLKQIDKEYYFRLDEHGNFKAESYCGNDLKTEAPMMRRLIVESILYWMKEYHVDGFRFDLGKLLDWETIETIIREAKKINPNVVFVCEPWGGGYDPKGFSLRGWGAWNDQIRNGVKGENPVNGLGWIFGKWYGNNSPERIKSYVNGTLVKDSLGLFQKAEHSVNYLESHDGYTLGDFIRIGLGKIKVDEVVAGKEKLILSEKEMKLHKLAALFLFTSRGITMIHAGQEFARAKVIETENAIPDPDKGKLDHNSYNKDNSTNYLNYEFAGLNGELLEYYRGLIKLRKRFSALRRADYGDVKFFDVSDNGFAVGYVIDSPNEKIIVLMNANPEKEEKFLLPEGKWNALVDGKTAGDEIIGTVEKEALVPASSGMILIR
ncbi:MAG: pullulanase [Chlorobi bacterium]|nr:pullulanase [Chlorobiota bacterium]